MCVVERLREYSRGNQIESIESVSGISVIQARTPARQVEEAIRNTKERNLARKGRAWTLTQGLHVWAQNPAVPEAKAMPKSNHDGVTTSSCRDECQNNTSLGNPNVPSH